MAEMAGSKEATELIPIKSNDPIAPLSVDPARPTILFPEEPIRSSFQEPRSEHGSENVSIDAVNEEQNPSKSIRPPSYNETAHIRLHYFCACVSPNRPRSRLEKSGLSSPYNPLPRTSRRPCRRTHHPSPVSTSHTRQSRSHRALGRTIIPRGSSRDCSGSWIYGRAQRRPCSCCSARHSGKS